MGKTLLMCVFIIFIFIWACAKTPEKKELPVIEPNEFHIEYADGDSLLYPGKPITVYFNSSQIGAGNFHFYLCSEYGEPKSEKFELSEEDSIFSRTFKIPENAQLVLFVVYPDNYVCGQSTFEKTEFVYKNNGMPIKNAYASMTKYFVTDSIDYIAKELEIYPDNVWAFVNTWYGKDKDSIQADIEKITAMEASEEEMNAVLAVAYSFTGNKEKALEHFTNYMKNENAPWAPLIAFKYVNIADFDSDEEVNLLIDAMNMRVDSDYNPSPTYYILNKSKKQQNEKLRNYLEQRCKIDIHSCHSLTSYYLDMEQDSAKAALVAENIFNRESQEKVEFDKRMDFGMSVSLLFGAEYSYKNAEYEKAMKYAKLAEKYIAKDYYQAEIYHIIAKTSKALNDNEKFDKYLKMSIANGSLTDADKLIKELYPEQNSDSILAGIFAEAMEYNEKAPEYKFADINGDTITPGNGRIQVIHFWGPGCKPCMDEKPALDEFGKELEDVDLYAVTGSVAYVKEHKLEFKNWQNIYDGVLNQAFLVNSIPRTYIIDQNGYVRFRKFGATEEYAEEKMVIDLLKKEQK